MMGSSQLGRLGDLALVPGLLEQPLPPTPALPPHPPTRQHGQLLIPPPPPPLPVSRCRYVHIWSSQLGP